MSLNWENFFSFLGNNDCYPHNIFYEGGPTNPTIRRFLDIWRPFIPYDQLHTFQSGGYFAVDVIPGKIRVLALNTLYFYNSNAAVDGCDTRGDPGRDHMVWLDTQLELARQLKLKVHITGHVPPRPKAYYSSCLREYTRIAQKYSDIIVGHWYGHVNMDHFVLLDEKDDEEEQDEFMDNKEEEDIHALKNIPKYLEDLHKRYKRGVQANASEQVVINISPPVLPVYLPTFRIIHYNANDIESPTFGDLNGYSQYFSNVTYWNKHQPKKLSTVDVEENAMLQKRDEDPTIDDNEPATPPLSDDDEDSFEKKTPAHSSKTKQKKPKKPKQGPMPYLEFELEYTTQNELGMKDLSRDSWVDLARRLTRKGKESEKFWRSYVDNIFVQTMRDEEL